MNKFTGFLLSAATLFLLLVSCESSKQTATTASKSHAQQGVRPIAVPAPPRPAGQMDMLAYAAPKIPVVRVGFIGLGMRGPGAVERWANILNTKIVALAD